MTDTKRHDPVPALLAPRYSRLRIVGRGGMGAVYRAWDSERRDEVAVKVIISELAANGLIRERFAREVKAMARLQHPAVVRFFEYGEVEELAYFTMEYVEGAPMTSLVGSTELGVPEAVRMVADVLDGLAAVHATGLVHRDIKPGNIVVSTAGQAKLMDFGLVKFADGATLTALTRTGQVVGTLRYLPPEILEGRAPDERCDVYQMGLVLYEVLEGELPVKGANIVELIRRADWMRVPRPKREGVDDELAAIMSKALAPDVGLRYPSAGAFRDGLRGWLQGLKRATARPSPSPVEPAEQSGRQPQVAISEVGIPSSQGRGKLVIPAVALLGAVLGVLAGLALRSSPPAVVEGGSSVPPSVGVAAAAEERDEIGWTRLHGAAYAGKVAAVESLLAAGASPDAVDDALWRPLHVASGAGRAEVVARLLASAADPEARDAQGRTALSWAAGEGHGAVVELLLAHGATVDGGDGLGRTPLHHAAAAAQGGIVATLLRNGAVVDARDRAGQTALHLAALRDAVGVVAALIAAGASPDAQDGMGQTALHMAVDLRRTGAVRSLVAAGAGLEVRDTYERTPLHQAAIVGNLEGARILLDAGAALDVRTKAGWTPLQYAEREGHQAVVELFRTRIGR